MVGRQATAPARQTASTPHNVVLPSPPGWQHFSVPFGALATGFGADARPWDPTTVMSFQWAVAMTRSPDVAEPFTICVDQVELIP